MEGLKELISQFLNLKTVGAHFESLALDSFLVEIWHSAS